MIDDKDKKRIQQYVKHLRESFKHSSLYYQTLAKAKSEEVGPKGGARYTCYICDELFPPSKVEVEHVNDTVVPFDKFYYQVSEREYYNRMFCDKDNLSIVCKECHKGKTAEERILRKEAKKKDIDKNPPIK